MKAYNAWVFFRSCFGCRASGEKQALESYIYCASGAFTVNKPRTEQNPHRYGLRALSHASVSLSKDQAALAGLVEGRQTAGRPLAGSIY